MNKKIKVIDLLNKIANRETVPKKIKWRDKIWNYVEKEQDYINYWNNRGRYFMSNLNDIRTKDFITDEVEILDESDEIEKLDKDGTFINDEISHQSIINMQNKINELIEAVNQLKKERK